MHSLGVHARYDFGSFDQLNGRFCWCSVMTGSCESFAALDQLCSLISIGCCTE